MSKLLTRGLGPGTTRGAILTGGFGLASPVVIPPSALFRVGLSLEKLRMPRIRPFGGGIPVGAPPPPVPPVTPTGFAATATSSSTVGLSWNTVPTTTLYRIERSPNGTSGWTLQGTTTGLTMNVTGLTEQTTYYWHIRAENVAGNSGYSTSVSATTQAAATGSAPGVPGNFIASATSSTSVSLNWSGSTGSPTGYEVQRSADAGATWTSVGNPTGTSQPDGSLTPSTTYQYQVRATNTYGYSGWATAGVTTNAAPSGSRTLLSAGDLTHLGSFRPPVGRTVISSGRTVVRVDALEAVVLPTSDPGMDGTLVFEPTSGTQVGRKWFVVGDNGLVSGGHSYHFYPVNLSDQGNVYDIAGQGYVTYRQFSTYHGAGYGYGGLGLRYVAGQLRLSTFTGVDQDPAVQDTGSVYEFTPPIDTDLSKDPTNLKEGTHIYCWADQMIKGGTYQTRNDLSWVLNPDWSGDITPIGLYWADPSTLYVTYGGDYQVDAACPSILKMVLQGDNTWVRYGPYRLEEVGTNVNISYKRACGGVLRIPQEWADTNLAAGGQPKLAVFGGGYFSLFAQHGGSAGACIYPIPDLPNVAYNPSGIDDRETQVPRTQAKTLLAYGTDGEAIMHRPLGVIDRNYFWHYFDGPCRGATSTTLTLWTPDGTDYDNTYNGLYLAMTSGPAAGNVRTITAYDGNSTSRATVDSPWSAVPNVGDFYQAFDGTVVSATSTSITLQAAPPSGRPFLKILSGTGAGQDERRLTSISGNNYSVTPAFTTTPAAGDRYRFYSYGYAGVPDPVPGSHAYMDWGDTIAQSMVWIDTPTRYGVLLPVSLGYRHQFYSRSALRGRGTIQTVFVFDPDDLAAVNAGTLQPNAVIPDWFEPTYLDTTSTLRAGYPGIDSPDPEPGTYAISSAYYQYVRGATYDQTTGRLYILTAGYPDVWMVHVYSVTGGG